MIYTQNIQKAVRYSIQVHELNRPERQLRKGKDIAYITQKNGKEWGQTPFIMEK